MIGVDGWSSELADKILHDLPEELAAGISFKMHEGGDALVLSYPVTLEGTPEFKDLDRVTRSHSGAFVSRGKGRSFYLIPKPKVQSTTIGAPVHSELPVPVPVVKPEPAAGGAKPKIAEDPKPASPTKASEPPKPAPQAAQTQNSNSQPRDTAKQPSPIVLFQRDYCNCCADIGGCDISTDVGRFHFAACLQILEMQQRQAISVSLEKLANRPVFTRKPASELPNERHEEGGISWYWNEAHTYEKALETENRDSKDYVALKKMLEDAATAGKKGLVISGFWCFLDSFKKDGLLRKKAQDFSNSNGGASK